MSDESELKETPLVVDGIQPNGVNAFVNKKLGIALVVKPVLTSEDFDKFVGDVVFNDSVPFTVNRARLFANAIGANIIVHITDKCTKDTAKKLDAVKVQWYGEKLSQVYYQYAIVDPN